ncbi:MAG TPA: transglycosylase SLT domain-containing protein [Anaerolineae bacterium]|nr:transglycosylase SLT domain-containing protein [Anaerolineae bacterium]
MPTLTLPDFPQLLAQPPAVRRKLAAVADRNGWDAAGMAAAILHESAWNPRAVNKGSGASGLIQIIPATARGLGTTVQAIRTMGAGEQLDLAERFWRGMAQSRPVGPLDWLVLGLGTGNVPGGYRADLPGSTVLYEPGTPGARGNPGLQDGGGAVTVGVARKALADLLTGVSRSTLDTSTATPSSSASGALVVVVLGAAAAWLLLRRKGKGNGKKAA